MKLYKCNKDGFYGIAVDGGRIDGKNDVFELIPLLYDPSVEIVSISFVNPDGTAQIRVEVDDPEKDHLLVDYYFIN